MSIEQVPNYDLSYLNHHIDELVTWTRNNIQRREKELNDDLQEHVIIDNRVLSSQLSSIPGMQRHLSHARAAKQQYESQVIPDTNSHGSFTIAELNRKYNQKR
jgi:hypothetical protein